MNSVVLMANCDYMSKWVLWARSWIVIALRWVTLQKPPLAFILPAGKMQFSLNALYTSFHVARSMWLLTIHRAFYSPHVEQLIAIAGFPCAQPSLFAMLKTCTTSAASAFSLVQIS
jgi:hypothetical protein